MKSRRETVLSLDMRRPAFLVLAAPHLHRFRVALDPSIFRVKMQFAVHLPRDVGKLQHRNCYIADRDRSVEFLALTNSRNEVREVSVGHGIAADQVGGGTGISGLELILLVSLEVIYLVSTAIDEHRPSSSHDCRTAIAAVILHSLAALALPRNHLVFVLETGHQRVSELR